MREEVKELFDRRKTQKIATVIIIVLIITMLATSILPAIV